MTTTEEIKANARDWMEKVNVQLIPKVDKISSHYVVTGDDRIPDKTKFPRVSSILDVLSKDGLIKNRRYKEQNYIIDTLTDMFTHIDPDFFKGASVKQRISEVVYNSAVSWEEAWDEAGAYGTAAHNLLEELTYDPEVFVERKFIPVVDAWFKFLDSNNFLDSIIATEQSLYYYEDEQSHGRSVKFAGTADMICRDSDGNLTIVDYKTSSRFLPEHCLQGAAYSIALKYSGNQTFLKDEDLERPVRVIILKLPKTEDKLLDSKEIKNISEHQQIFFNLCEASAWKSNTTNKWIRKDVKRNTQI